MEYSVVIGVDRKTIECLRLVYPTWAKNKPSLFKQPWHVIYDSSQVSIPDIQYVAPHLHDANFISWPPPGVQYIRDGLTKWTNPQRAKMLAGFVHAPALVVDTTYWLKLDLDVVAVGMDDWIDPLWFDDNPSVVAPKWSYTKPATQMVELDQWVEKYEPFLFRGTDPLNLIPAPGADTVPHARICSWCAFFSTEFTRLCSLYASQTLGHGQIPVDSQDGYLFYAAKRAGFNIRTIQPKKRGWKLCHSPAAVRNFTEALAE